MAVRAGLADLINEVRRLIGDPSPGTFPDDDYQDALDRNRTFIQYHALEALYDRASRTYTAFQGPSAWEKEAVVLRDYQDQEVVATSADLLAGRFTFDPGRADSHLTATGWTYDVAGAAVTILDWWIARLKGDYDVTVGGDTFNRSQRVESLKAIRSSLAGKSLQGALVTSTAFRSDQTTRRRFI
jgi:hypothetical protein